MMMVFVIYDRRCVEFGMLTLWSHPFHGYPSCPLSDSCMYFCPCLSWPINILCLQLYSLWACVW